MLGGLAFLNAACLLPIVKDTCTSASDPVSIAITRDIKFAWSEVEHNIILRLPKNANLPGARSRPLFLDLGALVGTADSEGWAVLIGTTDSGFSSITTALLGNDTACIAVLT